MEGAVHVLDIFTILETKGVVVRAGQHCVGLLMIQLRLNTTCYAPVPMNSTSAEIGVLLTRGSRRVTCLSDCSRTTFISLPKQVLRQ